MRSVCRPAWRGLILGAALAFAGGGCGGGANSPYPVEGTVFLDGEPAKELAGGMVTFNSSQLHKVAFGEIREDGTYRLGTLKPGDGAVPGVYQVTVSPPEGASRGERGGRAQGATGVSFRGPENPEVTVERRSNDIPILLHRGRASPR